MVSERLGRMPKRDDEVLVGRVRFRVESADVRRVKKIKISIETKQGFNIFTTF